MKVKQTSAQRLSNKEQTEMPDHTFPLNCFHVGGGIGTIIPPHWHDHLEWIAVVKGGFRVQVDTEFEDLVAGEVAFVNTRLVHSAFPIGEGCELYAVVFNAALMRNSSLDLTDTSYLIPLLQHDLKPRAFYRAEHEVTARIHESITRIVRLSEHREVGSELLMKASLFESLGYAIQHSGFHRTKVRSRRDQTLIQPLLQYLSENFHEPISVERAAQICCVSPNHLCYAFKKATGRTLLEYVHMLRIHEACQLLRTRQHSVQQIALMVGYSNMTYFGRVFKKLTNQTPSEYMKSI